ncbi:MAG: uracil phosphoribosyltransferase [Cytophagales bacterium]|jgi:uracil phosphoribosyltransferase|nr:uracil phosphoribosyltransferase [Cytophagales bacterium]
MKKIYITSLLACVACTLINNNKVFAKENYESQKSNANLSENNLIVLNHPLVQHHLSIIRDKNTKTSKFRASLEKIAELLIYEATKDLPTIPVEVETPMEKTICKRIDPSKKIFIASILRAGIAITSEAEKIIPWATTHHLGMYRDEMTHKPVWYYNKVPKNFADQSVAKVFVCDPMLASGGSALEAIKVYRDRGISEEQITFICVIGAPEGVKKLREAFPKIKIIMASLDRELNEIKYILPGLGDAGDRMHGTY